MSIKPEQQILLENMTEAILVLNAQGDIIFNNAGATRWAKKNKLPLSGSIHDIVQHDPLTGLPNRSLFLKLLPKLLLKAQKKKKHCAVFFIDLDHFKKINDHLGHDSGDALLKEVALRFQKQFRKNDLLVRQGGDEFTIAFIASHHNDIASIAERLLTSLKKPFIIHDRELYISASIGIAVYPECGDDMKSLLKSADIAMYHAKSCGRNNYQFFTEDFNKEVKDRLKIEAHLRNAIKNKELSLHYQPQIDLRTGKISHVEALLRWNNAELGHISPMEFIPVAEECGLITTLGEWVLKTACMQCQQWQTDNIFHPPVKMAVNISLHQLEDKNFLNIVNLALKKSGLSPEFLELEITESAVMHDPIKSISILNELHDLGISIAVDDFGTGYSSLAYLTHLPIDIIKIDRSFVRDIFKDPNDAIIVKSIIHLAHNLGMAVVAEGVEEKVQLTFLMENECDKVQGFLFCKPLTADDFIVYTKKPELSLPRFGASPYLCQMRRRDLQ